jgi:adenosylcobinamide kinase / adenosylcobinamide-phosphate guanylyltransferase
MRVLTTGTGGASGWPEPGCRCASCLRAVGAARARSSIVIDGVLTLGPEEAGPEGARSEDAGPALDPEGTDREGTGPRPADGYIVRQVPGGWDVTAPDGERLLYPARPGAVLAPAEGTAPYDIAFVDMLGDPSQLGLLRARGLVTSGTTTLLAFADHRVPSTADLRQRCAFWHVGLPDDGETGTTGRSDVQAIRRVLVIGGARSGKSERAELRVAAEPAVTYVAAGYGGQADPEWAARVAAHQARRPRWWQTAETTDLAGMLAGATGTLLIDGIGTWLAATMDECGAWDGGSVDNRITELVAAWRQVSAHVVAVSDETGLGVIPQTAAGRLFRDILGSLNQALAAESEEAELVVAGRAIPLIG